MAEQIINIERLEHIAALFGNFDENLRIIEKEYQVSVANRQGEIRILGDPEKVYNAVRAIDCLISLCEKGEPITGQTVDYCISMAKDGREAEVVNIAKDCVCVTAKGKPVKAKTVGQKRYVDKIKENTITFGVGPAGTGKTYLAVAMAVAAFTRKEVNRIILTRPAVEAGERLGFLPGDLQNKVDPYLRPLYDALFDMLGAETHQKYVEKGMIEVAPLAYMRGRTLDDSFIILDEAQNTTPEQMKMFLTRLGFNSKVVVTGDITQVDLPRGSRSGLREAIKIFKNIEDIAVCMLTEHDVVRHKLVQKIVKEYEKFEQENEHKGRYRIYGGGQVEGSHNRNIKQPAEN